MAFGLEFGIDQRSIHADLEAASVRGNEGYRLNDMLKLLEQVLFQAHGPVGVVSNCTVGDFDFEHAHSSIQRQADCNKASRLLSGAEPCGFVSG